MSKDKGDKVALPETGFLRVSQIIRLIPVDRSTWWSWVKQGRVKQPIKLGPRISAWRVEYIRELIGVLSYGSDQAEGEER